MSDQIKTTTIDQLPEATSLDDLQVFGYSPKNAVGKRSVKVPINLLKGNKGADGGTPTIGANGNWWINGQDTGFAAKYEYPLASEQEEGLMSIEQFNFITDMQTNMQNLITAIQGGDWLTSVTAVFKNSEEKTADIISAKSNAQKINYKVESPNYSFEGSNTALVNVTTPIVSGSDSIKVSFNSVDELVRIGGTYDAYIVASKDANLKRLTLDVVTAAKLIISGCEFLDNFHATYASFDGYNLSEARNLRVIEAWNNKTAEFLNINSEKIEVISVVDCAQLKKLTNSSKSLNSLKTLSLNGCPLIAQSVLMPFVEKWDRTGQSSGTLRVEKGLYDVMLASGNVTKLVNKNINVQGV